jgi:hypothetical protein
MTMSKRPILLLLLWFLPTWAFSQSDPVPNQIPNAASKPRRNSQEEDAVANLFDTVRKDANLRPLSRIKDRKSLEQLACTASVTAKVPLFSSGFPVLGNNSKFQDTPSALYKTVNPTELTPELQRIAVFERPRGQHRHTSGYSRYAVAVWSTQQEMGEKTEYWVGIELFWSAGAEFFLNHFSDAMEWKNEWKTFVVPECRDVR